MLPRSRWARWGFGVTTLLLTLAGLELGTRGVFATTWAQEKFRANTDASWRLQWVRRHREKQVEVFYPFDIYHQTRGWATTPDLKSIPVFDGKKLSTNGKGIRGVLEHPYEKPPGTFRVVILGDSTTFGDEVSDDETFSYFLQQMLPGVDFINLAVHGYGHDQMLLSLREEGVRYEPDLVLLGYLPMDRPRNLLSFRDFAKPRMKLQRGELVATHTPVPSPEEVLRREPWRLRILDAMEILKARLLGDLESRQRQAVALERAILGEIFETARMAGATPAIAFLDYLREPGMEPTEEEAAFIEEWARRGVPTAFLRPAHLQARQEEGLVPAEAHFNAAEHRVVAAALRDFLIEEGLVPSGSATSEGGPRVSP